MKVDNAEQGGGCETKCVSFLLLPREAVACILSFDRPAIECQVWEWIGIIGMTCKTIRSIAQDLAPVDFTLEDYTECRRLNGKGSFDARHDIITVGNDFEISHGI